MNPKRFTMIGFLMLIIVIVALGYFVFAGMPTHEISEEPSRAGFYGSGIGSDSLANIDIGGQYHTELSNRFRAHHTGLLRSIRTYFIWNTAGWRPGYALGTGGIIEIQLQPDDDSPNHHPSGTVLASATIKFDLVNGRHRKPDTENDEAFQLITFPSPARLEGGRLYHITFKNIHPDPVNNYLGQDNNYIFEPTTPMQPTINDADWAVLSRFREGDRLTNWELEREYTPILELYYDDGGSEGLGYMEVWVEPPKEISGSNATRERFTVSGQNRKVSSVSVRLARASGKAPLTVRLERGDGTLIEQGTIPANTFPLTRLPHGEEGWPMEHYTWGTLRFRMPHALIVDQTYNLVLTTPAGTRYKIFPIREGSLYEFSPTTFFADGYAQYTNDGLTWEDWPYYGDPTEGPSTEADLQFYFTVVPDE